MKFVKKMLFGLLLLLLSGAMTPSWAKKMAVLPGLMNPTEIIVNQDKLYIIEGIHIFVYSSQDYSLIKKVGKEGEGPQEFRKYPFPGFSSLVIYVRPDYIFVGSPGKILFFDHNWNFIREQKTQHPFNRIIPLGNQFAGLAFAADNSIRYLTTNLYNANLEKVKEIFPMKFYNEIFRPVGSANSGRKNNPIKISLLDKLIRYYSANDTLLIPTPDGLVHAFNAKGEKLYTITHDYPQVPITSDLENQFDELYSNDIRYKTMYNLDKKANNLAYPSHMPFIQELCTDNGYIYIVSYVKKNDSHQAFIFDAKTGKFVKELFLPVRAQSILELYPFTIHKNNVYQLIENEADEEWELHITQF